MTRSLNTNNLKDFNRCSRYASLLEHREPIGFRVEPNEVRFVSRKPLSVFSIRFATRTPKSIRFSSRTERSEVRIEKTIIGVLDTLRYSNTVNYSGFRVVLSNVKDVSRKPLCSLTRQIQR